MKLDNEKKNIDVESVESDSSKKNTQWSVMDLSETLTDMGFGELAKQVNTVILGGKNDGKRK